MFSLLILINYFDAPILHRPMKTSVLFSAVALLLLCASCHKEEAAQNLSTTPDAFVEFVIPKGEHYAVNNVFKPIETAAMNFMVRFDSSAIYTTADPENQYDINKLYGFSDNNGQHHLFSARIGWRWSDGALRLFAYTYNNGIRNEKELATVAIGKEHHCAIQVADSFYIFFVNEKILSMPRLSATSTAKGYQLYPYFGGDEVAPHEVRIWISEER